MADAGLQEVNTYVSSRKNTVLQYIATRPIMYLCLASKRRPGPRVEMQWWEQEGMNLERIRRSAWEEERMEGGEDTDGTDTAMDD